MVFTAGVVNAPSQERVVSLREGGSGGDSGKLKCARPSNLQPRTLQAQVAGLLISSRSWKSVP